MKIFSWHRPRNTDCLPPLRFLSPLIFCRTLTFLSVTEAQLSHPWCQPLGLLTGSPGAGEHLDVSTTLQGTYHFFSSIMKMHFNMGSWKRAEKLKWSTSIFIIHECSKQCLKTPWQDLSMQFHSRGCRQEYTEFCKHGHAWFTDLSMQSRKMLKFNSPQKVAMQRNIWLVFWIPFKRSSVHLGGSIYTAKHTWPAKHKWFVTEGDMAGSQSPHSKLSLKASQGKWKDY